MVGNTLGAVDIPTNVSVGHAVNRCRGIMSKSAGEIANIVTVILAVFNEAGITTLKTEGGDDADTKTGPHTLCSTVRYQRLLVRGVDRMPVLFYNGDNILENAHVSLKIEPRTLSVQDVDTV